MLFEVSNRPFPSSEAVIAREIYYLINRLDHAADTGLIARVDISYQHITRVNFDDQPMINRRLHNIGNYQDCSADLIKLAIKDLGRHSRIFYLSAYSHFDKYKPNRFSEPQLSALRFTHAARFWFENKQYAMLFKLKYA